jgi:ubiquitin carboxyl-terminal hydrolase 8
MEDKSDEDHSASNNDSDAPQQQQQLGLPTQVDDENGGTNEIQQQQQLGIPAQFTPPDGDDEDVDTKEMHQKNKKSRATSIFRVGSLRIPNSPKRAANYNHVHEAVAINFQDAAVAGKRNSPLGIVGFRNLGNTCFLNSSLQCLSATIPLTDYFLAYQYKQEINYSNHLGTGGKLVVEYAELMKAVWLGHNAVVRPQAFKNQLERFAPQFRGFRQHDSQEFLAYLLDGIHEDLNRIEKKPYIEDRDYDGTNDEQDAIEAWKNYLRRDKSLIVDIFQGQTRSRLQCLKCGHSNLRFEPFMYLSLPISAKCRTITDCLELYLEQENMVGVNQWYCGKCKVHVDATKKTDLWILPPILIVHLKRFNFNDYGHLGSKNNAALQYPLQDWNLSKYVHSEGSELPMYDCYAVSNHVGGLGGGHYTAYGQSRFNDQWFEFNDSSYRPIDDSEIKRNTSSAYVLFYNRIQGERSDGSSMVDSTSGRMQLIRRQSENRPDLWPHTQVQDRQFREFTRQSLRSVKAQIPPAPFLTAGGVGVSVDDSEKCDME